MGLEIHQLKTFFVLARTLNFTEAARKLYVTQPAVSHAMKKLESGLNDKLIVRRGNRLVLTESGSLLYKTCEDIFYRLERAEEAIRSRKGISLGVVRLGATVEFGNTVLVKNLRAFMDGHPNVHVDFLFHHDLRPLLLNDELDVIVDCRDDDDPQLDKRLLFQEKYVVVGAPDYIRRKRIRQPKDLESCTVLSFDKDGSWWNKFLLAVPERERPTLAGLIEINHIRGLVIAAKEGVGIGLVPRYSVSRELAKRELVDLFPRIALREDHFFIYQKKKKAGLEKHRLLVEYLLSLKPVEFGETRRRVAPESPTEEDAEKGDRRCR
ncbi:MAG: LysR family transcriptional regulator [Acidobacteriota bacterium]|nr:LysR family transcriptional regulator [Acidobacteriota bacterium]